MTKKRILRIIESILIALIFFVLGRLMAIQMGTLGIWIAVGLSVIFYVVWWFLYQRDKRRRSK